MKRQGKIYSAHGMNMYICLVQVLTHRHKTGLAKGVNNNQH